MARKKLKLELIANATVRKATFRKRMKGLRKKLDEISTLCGIEACAIVYSPYDPQPQVWSSPWGVQRVLNRFTQMSVLEQSKKKLNQESFLRQKIKKAKVQLKKEMNANREMEMTLLKFECIINPDKIIQDNMSMMDLNDLAWLVDQNLRDVNRKMEELNNKGQVTQSQTLAVAAETAPDGAARNKEKAHVDQGQGLMRKQHSFMDLINGAGDDDEEALLFSDFINHHNGF